MKTKIGDYMTIMPHAINSKLSLGAAKKMMQEYGIRHLPVQTEGKIVGIISARDIKSAHSTSPSIDLKVEDLMSQDPYIVSAETDLSEALNHMAKHKYGSVLVENQKGGSLGIFTSVDAVRLLAEILQ